MERKSEKNGRRATNGQPGACETPMDCCMVAAELFCGIEQTTTVYYRWMARPGTLDKAFGLEYK